MVILMDAYCTRQRRQCSEVEFWSAGRSLLPTDRSEQLGLNEPNVIQVLPHVA